MSGTTETSVQAIEWGTGLSNAWSSIANFVPKLAAFLVVLLIGWLIAKAVSKAVALLLDKVGFGRLIARTGMDRFFQSSSITPAGLLTKLIYYFILLIALQLALTAFGPSNPVSEIVNKIVLFLPRAIVAVVIVIIVAAIANGVKNILEGALGGLSYGPLLAKIVAGFIIALGVIAALGQVGIGLTVTMPVLIAVLATIGGVIVVGVGGGLITPMRDRWEGWLTQISDDTKQLKADRERRAAERPAQQPAYAAGGFDAPTQAYRTGGEGQPYTARPQGSVPQGQGGIPQGGVPQGGAPQGGPGFDPNYGQHSHPGYDPNYGQQPGGSGYPDPRYQDPRYGQGPGGEQR